MGAYAVIILILIFLYTFFMGFNDGSNAIATTIATRAIKPRTAVYVAAAVKFIVPVGIYVVGLLVGEWGMSVAGNISDKTIYLKYFETMTKQHAFVFMLSAMLGNFIWCVVAFFTKIPLSTSHALIGGIMGSAIAAFGFFSIQWKEYILVNVILMVVLAPVLGLIISFILMKLVKRLVRKASTALNNLLIIIQRLNLIVLSATFASNNAQKGFGVVLMMSALGIYAKDEISITVALLIAASLALGVLLGGYRVVNTLGRKIFKIKDIHSVVAQLSTNIIMIAATEAGIAVSTGQIMSSSIMGLGAAERVSGVRWNMAVRIAVSWVLTLPMSGLIAAGVYFALKAALGI